MYLPVTINSWLLAFLPLLVLLFLMLAKKWGAAEAGPIAWLVSIGTAWFYFEAPAEAIGFESVKGAWSAVTVLYVVWASILIYEVTHEGGAFDPLRRGITRVMPDPRLQVLAFGWAFSSFLQGVTGVGVPIAVCAPLLVGIGVRPLYAVVIPLIGHAWNNTFGTLSLAWLGLKQVAAMEPALAAETALYASAFIWILNIIGGFLICWLCGRFRGIWHGLPAILVISTIHGGLSLVLSQWNDVLNGFIASGVAFIAVFCLAYLPCYRRPKSSGLRVFQEESGGDGAPVRPAAAGSTVGAMAVEKDMTLHQAFIPYYALLVMTFGILLVPSVYDALNSYSFGLGFPATVTGLGFERHATTSSMAPFTHAGTFLLASAVVGYFAFNSMGGMRKGSIRRILHNTVDKSIPSTIAVVSLIATSNVMAGSGSVEVLAHGVADATGEGFGFLAPLVGGLGSFMTTSNLASNLLFGTFQSSTAEATALLKSAILGAQTAGGAVGTMIAPAKVLLGTTTAGILGQEGNVLRITIPLFLLVSFIIGIVVFLVA